MEAPVGVALEREAVELAPPSDVAKPPGASLRWRWSSPATQVLPSDVPPPWLSPARAAPPPAAAPAPAPARESSAEVDEYSSWHGAGPASAALVRPALDAFPAPAALPEELLEAVMRLLDAQLREWPERGSLLAVRCAARRPP